MSITLEIDSVRLNHSDSKPKINRWHLARAAIYSCRTLLSAAKNSVANTANSIILPSQSYFLLNRNLDNLNCFKIDQTTLTELVKEKNQDQLRNLQGIEAVASALETHVESGIPGDDEDIARRHQAFGLNSYKEPPTKSIFHFVVEAYKDPPTIILLLCAAILLPVDIKEYGWEEGWYDGGIIFLAVFLVKAVSAISKYRQNQKFHKLSKLGNNIQIDVVRSGRRQQISIFEIVVGDVICLKIGDQVPANGLFLDGHSFRVDESSETGESGHVEVNGSQNPFLFSGTKVVDGYARMLVTSVGMNTTWGQMMSQISHDTTEQTPLQARLNKLNSPIEKAGYAVSFIVLVGLLVRYFTGKTKDDNGDPAFKGSKTKVVDMVNVLVWIIISAVSVVEVAILEDLPMALRYTLAYTMKKMMAGKARLRKHSACETMGFATIICTDKTGTLTLNQMNVTKFWLGQESMEQSASYSSISPCVVELIQEGVALNTTGSVYRETSSSDFEFSGSPTEKAILSWAVREIKMDMEDLKQSCTVLYVDAFNSQKKRSGVMIRKKLDNTIHVHWKGAAEMILAMCSSYYDASGSMKDMNDSVKTEFAKSIEGMAASGLRCIAFAHKQVTEQEDGVAKDQKELSEDGLTLLGLVGIKDPCRPGVKKAVEGCQYAGVNVKMITGDNVFTAKAIASECGILRHGQDTSSGAVVEGEKFRNYTPDERMEEVDKIRVMARSSQSDKLLMVQCLKEKGYVVVVTGDGINDVSALKEADIGLSMGIQGTEVARKNSDIVILNDDFSTVTTVLWWGRCVYNNIQKVMQFQLTICVVTLVINLVTTIWSGEVSLTIVQSLWVSLIIETLGPLALATENPTKEQMEKPPVGRTEPLITNIMWKNLLGQALFQIAALLTLQFKGEPILDISKEVRDTLIFNTLVLCQVFNEFNVRKLEKKNVFKGIHKNKLFMWIIGIIIVIQVVMVEVEFLNRFAGTKRPSGVQWGACIGIAGLSWPIDWVVKCIPVPKKTFLSYLKW